MCLDGRLTTVSDDDIDGSPCQNIDWVVEKFFWYYKDMHIL